MGISLKPLSRFRGPLLSSTTCAARVACPNNSWTFARESPSRIGYSHEPRVLGRRDRSSLPLPEHAGRNERIAISVPASASHMPRLKNDFAMSSPNEGTPVCIPRKSHCQKQSCLVAARLLRFQRQTGGLARQFPQSPAVLSRLLFEPTESLQVTKRKLCVGVPVTLLDDLRVYECAVKKDTRTQACGRICPYARSRIRA